MMRGRCRQHVMILGALLAASAGVAAWRSLRDRGRPGNETTRVRDLYDRAASRYDAIVRLAERLLVADGRQWAAARASGDVLEIAIGTGRNIPCYSPDVRLAGQDISLPMLQLARGRARAAGRDVHLSVGDAQRLAFPSDQFDCVVGTLVLCTIPDERRALAEAWRVLRPGGRLILVEHVRSPRPIVRLLQRLLEPLAVCAAGDHLLRDPLDHLADLGYAVGYCARSRAGIVERLIARKIQADSDHPSGGRHQP